MGRTSKPIILTNSKKKLLEQGSNNIFRRHCEAILLNASGKTIKELSVDFSLRVIPFFGYKIGHHLVSKDLN